MTVKNNFTLNWKEFLFPTEKDSALKGASKKPSALSQQSKVKLMSSSVVVRLADFNIYQVCFIFLIKSSDKQL